MQFLKYAVADAVKRHPFQRVADLGPDEFAVLMVDVLNEAMQSHEFQERLSDEIREAAHQLKHR